MLIEIKTPAPVLNTPDYSFAFGGKTGSEIPLNEKGHPYCNEFVALPGMTYPVEETLEIKGSTIYRIGCGGYPEKRLYLDSRFAKPAAAQKSRKPMPARAILLERMAAMAGTPYVWGGNWKAGIPEMLQYYPAQNPIDDHTAIYWTLCGVDCSGLLFEASEGTTPRNTSQLVYFGQGVPTGEPLQPLDMILYPGHVAFVVDPQTTIESKFPFGVIQRDLATRLWEFEKSRKRVEEWNSALDPLLHYTIRRFT